MGSGILLNAVTVIGKTSLVLTERCRCSKPGAWGMTSRMRRCHESLPQRLLTAVPLLIASSATLAHGRFRNVWDCFSPRLPGARTGGKRGAHA